jgi:hypothetical protein
MALQLAFTSDQTNVGLAAPEAYARFEHLSFTAPGDLHLVVAVYANAATRLAGKRSLFSMAFIATGLAFATSDVQAEVYTYLKTLPEFAGATDV